MGCSTPRTTKAGPSHGAHKVVDIDSVRDTCSNLSPSSRPPPPARSNAQVKSQTDRGQASNACLGLVCFSKSHRGQDTRSTHLPLVRVSTNYSLCLLDRGLLQICITHLYPSWLLHIHIKDDAHTRLRSKDKAQSVPECSPRTVSRPARSPERRTGSTRKRKLSRASRSRIGRRVPARGWAGTFTRGRRPVRHRRARVSRHPSRRTDDTRRRECLWRARRPERPSGDAAVNWRTLKASPAKQNQKPDIVQIWQVNYM